MVHLHIQSHITQFRANRPFLSARKRQILTKTCQKTAFANMLWIYEDLPLPIWAFFALFCYAVVFWRMYGTEDKQIVSFCLNIICWSWDWTLESIAADTCRTAGYHQALIFVITFVFLSVFLCICICIFCICICIFLYLLLYFLYLYPQYFCICTCICFVFENTYNVVPCRSAAAATT